MKRYALNVVMQSMLFVFMSLTTFSLSVAHALELTILHTNDTHSVLAGIDPYGNPCLDDSQCRGGAARIAAFINTKKQSNDNVIALDAGDMFQGALFYTVHKWPMLAKLCGMIPYDAMTLGNHEFDEGCLALAQFIAANTVPLLAANLAPKKGCPLLGANYKPWRILTIRGEKVALIGLANDEVKKATQVCAQTAFRAAKDVLSEAVQELEGQGIKYIIALTHLGLDVDRELARSVAGVDCIVGGHTHSYLGANSPEGTYPIVEKSARGENVLIVTAKHSTEYIGMLTIRFDEQGIAKEWSGHAQELLVSFPREQAISAWVQDLAKDIEAYNAIAIGSHTIDLPDGIDLCREGECLGGLLTADAMLHYGKGVQADLALENGGGIRASLPKGKITRAALLAMHPFGNTIVIRDYTGEQLLAALEHGVADEDAHGPNLLHPAGLRYVVKASNAPGKRIVQAEVWQDGQWQRLNVKQSYRVVLSSYLAKGNEFKSLAQGTPVLAQGNVDLEVIEDYVRFASPLTTLETGRIVYQD